MPEIPLYTSLNVVVLPTSDRYRDGIREALAEIQVANKLVLVDILHNFDDLLTSKQWDTFICFVPHLEALLSQLVEYETFPSLFLLYEAHEEERAFSFTDPRIVSILPVHAIHRLPFILTRESKLRQLQRNSNQLQQAENRFKAIVEGFGDPIIIVDRFGIIRYTNDAVDRVLGYHVATMLGQPFERFLPQSGRESTRKLLADLQESEQLILTMTHPFQRSDKEWAVVETTGHSMFDPEENLFIVLHLRDVTNQQRDKDALRMSEARYRAIVEDQTEYICRYDTSLRLTFVNQAYAQSYGMSPDEMVGQSILERIPLSEHHPAIAHVRALTSTNPVATTEHRTIMPDQSTRWIQWTDRAVVDESGKIVEYQGVGRDITDRVQAQNELQSLYEATSALFAKDDLAGLGQQIVETVIKVFDQADCGLMLIDSATKEIIRVARAGKYNLQPSHPLHLDGTGLVPQALRTGKMVYSPDVSRESNYVANESRTKSELVIPLRTAKGVIGAIDLQHIELNAFKESERRVLQAFAERAALAIATMQLNEALSRYASDLETQVLHRTAELEKRKASVEAILNNSPDAILLLDHNLHIQQANRQFQLVFGFPVENCFGQSLMALIQPEHEEKLRKFIHAENENGKHLELKALRHDGTVFDVEFSVGVIRGEGLVCVIRDITERKEQERQLRYFASFQEHISDAVIATNTEFHILSWNKAAERIYGWTAEEVIGKTVRDVLHTQHRPGMSREIARQQLANNNDWHNEVRQKHKNGKWLDISASVSQLIDENGKLMGAVAVNRDISERKAFERELQYHASLQENVSDAVIVTDMEFHIQSWNKAAERIYGWTAEEAIGKVAPELLNIRFYTPSDSEASMKRFNEQGSLQQETTQRRKDGKDIFILGSATRLIDENDIAYGIIAVNRDISERKAFERELQYHASLQENVSDAVIVTDMEFHIQSWNKAAERIYGWKAEEVIGTSSADILRTELSSDVRQETIRQLQEQGWWQGEVIQHHRDGRVIYMWGSVTLIKDDHGEPFSVVAVNHDISERKQAHIALVESEARYRLLAENISDVIVKSTQEGIRTYITPSCYPMLGYHPDELIGRPLNEIAHPDDKNQSKSFVHDKLNSGANSVTLTKRLRHKAGHYVWVEITSTIVRDPDNDGVIEVISVMRDTTTRKQFEEALRLSEEKFRQLIDAAPIATIVTTRSGEISLVNKQAEILFGYARDDLIGQSVEVLIPDTL